MVAAAAFVIIADSMATTDVIRVRRKSQVASAAATAAAALTDGRLVAFPTETVYGIAAVATHAQAMDALRELKSRPARPFTVHVGSADDVARYVRRLPGAAARLIANTWPGPVTVIVPTGSSLPDRKLNRPEVRAVLCPRGSVGLRCPDQPVAAAMLSAVDEPIVAPSANLIGGPSPRSGEDVLEPLDGRIDLLIDAGPTRCGVDSSIVLFDGGRWQIVREGAVGGDQLLKAMRIRIAFVCTGNTCRSPMAAGIARALAAERLGCDVNQLPEHGIEIVSAGVMAHPGQHATPEAQHAAAKYGADLADHRSRRLTERLINATDMLFCMSGSHAAAARRLGKAAAEKVRRVDDDADIPDPIGGGVGVYRKTAATLRRAIRNLLEENVL